MSEMNNVIMRASIAVLISKGKKSMSLKDKLFEIYPVRGEKEKQTKESLY